KSFIFIDNTPIHISRDITNLIELRGCLHLNSNQLSKIESNKVYFEKPEI
ncbi:hypothetical protein BY458DRAFT_437444, partial [Sporodiniella umbellata]